MLAPSKQSEATNELEAESAPQWSGRSVGAYGQGDGVVRIAVGDGPCAIGSDADVGRGPSQLRGRGAGQIYADGSLHGVQVGYALGIPGPLQGLGGVQHDDQQDGKHGDDGDDYQSSNRVKPFLFVSELFIIFCLNLFIFIIYSALYAFIIAKTLTLVIIRLWIT